MTGPNLFKALSGGKNVQNLGNSLKSQKSDNNSDMFSSLINKSSDSKIVINDNSKAIKNNDIHDDYSDYKAKTNNQIVDKSDNPIKDKISESKDEIDEFEKQIIKTISEDLDVDEETVISAMEQLGFNIFDLLSPQNLAELSVEIKAVEDVSLLILDDDFQQLLTDVNQIEGELIDKLELTENEFTELVSMMNVLDEPEQNGIQIQDLRVDFDKDGNLKQMDSVEIIETEDSIDTTTKSIDVQTTNEEQFKESKDNFDEDDNLNKNNNLKKELERTELNNNSKSDIIFGSTENVANNHEVNLVENNIIENYMSDETLDIIEQIVENTKVVFENDSTTMEMQLNPDSLGKVYVAITSKAGNVNAQFTVTNETVKEALEAQIVNLKDNLNQAGVKVDAVEVTVASHEFERNLEQDHSREEQEGARAETTANQRRNINLSSLDELTGLMSEEEMLVAQMMRDNGNSVDLHA